MLVLIRFRVADPDPFRGRVAAAVAVLRARDGFMSSDLVRNLDDPELWALVSSWRDVGSYRRALQGYEARLVVVPLLSEALDEPTAYEDPDLL
ncbi:MAG TPA: antibiotic biosynthesis monooxygenase [Microlunatus sp.]|nr:antibiotic biosynthesis monooxygenase [Microlunatus sp.]